MTCGYLDQMHGGLFVADRPLAHRSRLQLRATSVYPGIPTGHGRVVNGQQSHVEPPATPQLNVRQLSPAVSLSMQRSFCAGIDGVDPAQRFIARPRHLKDTYADNRRSGDQVITRRQGFEPGFLGSRTI